MSRRSGQASCVSLWDMEGSLAPAKPKSSPKGHGIRKLKACPQAAESLGAALNLGMAANLARSRKG